MHRRDETWSGMSDEITERRGRVEGLGVVERRILQWGRGMCTRFMLLGLEVRGGGGGLGGVACNCAAILNSPHFLSC